MGGGSKRSQSDAVERRLKKTKNQAINGSGAGGGGQNAKSAPESCPLTFPVGLPSKPALAIGTKPLELKNEGGTLWAFYKLIKLAKLDVRRNKQILICLRKGFQYTGVVRADEEGKAYAEFSRSS